MTITNEEIDLSQLFDFEVACEWRGEGVCDLPARWILTTTCCNTKGTLCDYHARYSHKRNQEIIDADGFLTCAHCGAEHNDAGKWIIWERL